MRKMLLTGGLIAAAALLNGCIVVSCKEPGAVRRPCVIGGPSWRVGVVFLPRVAEPRVVPPPASAFASCPVEKPGYNDRRPDRENEPRNPTRTRGVAQL